MIGFVYNNGGSLTANQDLGLKIATPCGTLVGQLLFGWLADVVGRKKMYGVELMISASLLLSLAPPAPRCCCRLLLGVSPAGRELTRPGCARAVIVATVGQAVAGHGPAVNIIGVLVMWRFIMGVGIGGDYPLSATISSEFAATRIRGRSAFALRRLSPARSHAASPPPQ